MTDSRSASDADTTASAMVPFADLGLPDFLLDELSQLGYEASTPIQAGTIPALLAGRDLLGQAQTGTGKTAAFALPVLARLQQQAGGPQALVLAPTRELAIQVAEAFQRYAGRLPGFHVLPIYGGQAYGPQLAGLRRGASVVVGTPGRIIDHLDKGTLNLGQLTTLVLDEADEMLRMGFIDDVEQVLSKMPDACQIALFSATMPPAIRRIAERYLKQAEQVTIRSSTTTAATIRQRYWLVSGLHKLDALTRILEVETFDGMIVFARTRVATEELAQRLNARGFAAAALNGDVPQAQREQLVDRLKSGEVDILVATDVAARGLDVERISHVVNYDIPYDTEAYVHRIGRTGRAGRSGEAILFVAPRERGMLRAIERATRQPIEPMGVPSVADVNAQRVRRFKSAISHALENDDLSLYREVVEACQQETGAEMADVASALARLVRGGDELLLDEPGSYPVQSQRSDHGSDDRHDKRHDARHDKRFDKQQGERSAPQDRRARDRSPSSGGSSSGHGDAGLMSYRIEVGEVHGVRTGNIVGAIANESGLDAARIGRIRIREHFSLVELPSDLPVETLKLLAGVRVAGQALNISPDRGPGGKPGPGRSERPERTPRREGPVRETWRPGARPERQTSRRSEPAREEGSSKAPGKRATRDGDDSGNRPPRRPKQSRAARKAGHTPRRVKPGGKS